MQRTNVYRGIREVSVHRGVLTELCHVYVFGARGRLTLPLRLDLTNHSPTGFEWGYLGSGPAQLALALLAHALDDDDRALALHQTFKRRVIAPLSRVAGFEWELTKEQIVIIAKQIEEES